MTLQFSQVKAMPTEIMALLDTTGSETDPVAPGKSPQKCVVMMEAFEQIVTVLQGKDTLGEDEEGGGGVFTVTFAGGRADVFGDVRVDDPVRGIKGNLQHFADTRRWSGSTYIMPGLNALRQHYKEEILDDEELIEKPALLGIIMTDGGPLDNAEFERDLAQHADEEFIVIALSGYGHDYDKALHEYSTLAAKYPNIAVIELGTMADGNTVAQRILSMIS